MNKLSFHAAALTLAVLPLAGPPALAQDSAAQRVEITGTRYDVRTLCPAIEVDLRTQLARRLRMLPEQAMVQVTFNLDGRSIDNVQTRGSSFDARKAVRQSVQQIGCDNGRAGRQQVRFDVVYRWHADAGQPVAQQADSVRVAAVGAR